MFWVCFMNFKINVENMLLFISVCLSKDFFESMFHYDWFREHLHINLIFIAISSITKQEIQNSLCIFNSIYILSTQLQHKESHNTEDRYWEAAAEYLKIIAS